MARKAIEWPNGLGWNVGTRYGTAEVRDQVSRLRVFAPIAPDREWSSRRNRWISIERYRVCDVPTGTDPVIAVEACLRHGTICNGDSIGDRAIPFVQVG